MQKSLNKVELRGRIGHDPRVATLENGSKVARFSVATSEMIHVKDDEWREETSWHNVVVWTTRSIQNVDKLKRGMFIELHGKLRYSRYTNKSGEERYVAEVVATRVVIPTDAQDEPQSTR